MNIIKRWKNVWTRRKIDSHVELIGNVGVREFVDCLVDLRYIYSIKSEPLFPTFNYVKGFCWNYREWQIQQCEADGEWGPADECRRLMTQIMKLWPKHSGDNLFPIPPADPTNPNTLTPMAAYRHQAYEFNDDYHDNRMELLDFVIDELRRRLT